MDKKVIYCDIDNTICFTPHVGSENMYENAIPWRAKIRVMNALYLAGHTIVYWTARGSSSGNDHRDLTEAQLDFWGCLYHELKLGKPSFDIMIDDKALTSLSAPEAFEKGLLEL